MSATAQHARRWLEEQRQACVVSIVTARGSTPRVAGTRMLVDALQIEGTIGGGHVEEVAIGLAREALSRIRFAPFEREWALGPSLGQCCGGVMRLRFEALEPASIATWPSMPSRFHLQLYGAGHVGRAIVRAVSPLPCTVRWVESRRTELELFHRLNDNDSWHPALESLASIEPVLCEDPVSEVRLAPETAVHLVMTHSHALDFDLVSAILRGAGTGPCGLIGSQSKKIRFERQLAARGIAHDRLVCPIGLPGLHGKEPEVIAASVAAQLLMGQWGIAARPTNDRAHESVTESLSSEPVSAGGGSGAA